MNILPMSSTSFPSVSTFWPTVTIAIIISVYSSTVSCITTVYFWYFFIPFWIKVRVYKFNTTWSNSVINHCSKSFKMPSSKVLTWRRIIMIKRSIFTINNYIIMYRAYISIMVKKPSIIIWSWTVVISNFCCHVI